MSDRSNELAFLANSVYLPNPVDRDVTNGDRTFSVEATAMDPATGFFATAYRDVDSGRYIIAFRGTDDPLDVAVDGAMVTSRLDLQQIESEIFTRDVLSLANKASHSGGSEPDVTVTGHSLGGGLAEINAAKFGLRGETFNSYGATGLIGGTPEGGNQVINHVRAGDPVSAANRHFGEVKIYATPDDIATLKHAGYGGEQSTGIGATVKATALSAHSMSNFIPKHGETPLIGPEGESLYLANKDIVDHYRSDVLRSREMFTHASESPAMIAPTLAVRAGQAYVDHLKHDMHELAERSVPVGQDVGRGAVVAAQAVGASARELGHDVIGGARVAGLVPEIVATATWGSPTGSPQLDRLLHPPKLTEPGHPDHAMFQQALRGVHTVDASTGRQPDQMSENLAGALTVEARRNGMNRIDHVEMNSDFSRAYAVQGDANSPFKKFAEVPTEIGVGTSIESSSFQWQQAAAHDASQQVAASQSMAQPTIEGPTHGR